MSVIILPFQTNCTEGRSVEIVPAIDLDGIADFVPYSGIQPELVSGTNGKTVTGRPVLRHVYLVAPNILALTIDEYGFVRNGAIPYRPESGDSVSFHEDLVIKRVWEQAGITQFLSDKDINKEAIGFCRFVYRNKKPLGHLVGKEGTLLWPAEPVYGEAWDWTKAENPRFYEVYLNKSMNDEDFIVPEVVWRKTKPHGNSNVGPGYDRHWCYQHQIYLQFADSLQIGQKIYLDLSELGLAQKSTTVLLDDKHLRTEALQVSQAGYHPQQSVKYAFLSSWMGTGGAVDYSHFQTFSVIDERSGKEVFQNKPLCISTPQIPDYTTKEGGSVYLARTYVYVLDFSSLTTEGIYRIYIPGLGVSFPFVISRSVWDMSARLQMMGFYNQRSGMALGPPATIRERPRNFHPDDRMIHDVDRSIYFNRDLYSEDQWRERNPFTRLQKSMLFDTNLPEAYGGWADAADYDRKIDHLRAVMAMLFLYEINPDYFKNWSLSLPTDEATNSIPDILDEALWCSELFRRTQLASGEVIEGIESIQHPKRGESSWLESLPTAIKPGTPSVAYKWAATAARMSKVLISYDTVLADAYKTSALGAIAWAKDNLDNAYYHDFQPDPIDMMSAGVNLYLLTGDTQWHDLFVRGWNSSGECSSLNQIKDNPYSLLSYALMSPEDADPDIQQKIQDGIISFADTLLDGINENSAFLLRPKGQRMSRFLVEQQGSEYLIVAHLLIGEERFLDGLLKCSLFSMGANPLNLCYTTGMGQRFIEPFYLDYEYTGLPIPCGIPAFGPERVDNPLPEKGREVCWNQRLADAFAPALKPTDIQVWPVVELYFRYVGLLMNEFTISQGMREQLTRWAYLSQYFSDH